MATASLVPDIQGTNIDNVLHELTQAINTVKTKISATTAEMTSVKETMDHSPADSALWQKRMLELNDAIGRDTQELTKLQQEFNKCSASTASPVQTPSEPPLTDQAQQSGHQKGTTNSPSQVVRSTAPQDVRQKTAKPQLANTRKDGFEGPFFEKGPTPPSQFPTVPRAYPHDRYQRRRSSEVAPDGNDTHRGRRRHSYAPIPPRFNNAYNRSVEDYPRDDYAWKARRSSSSDFVRAHYSPFAKTQHPPIVNEAPTAPIVPPLMAQNDPYSAQTNPMSTPAPARSSNPQKDLEHTIANAYYHTPTGEQVPLADILHTIPYFNKTTYTQVQHQEPPLQPVFSDTAGDVAARGLAVHQPIKQQPQRPTRVLDIQPECRTENQNIAPLALSPPPKSRNTNATPNYYNQFGDGPYSDRNLPCAPYRNDSQDFTLFRMRFERTVAAKGWPDDAQLTNLLHLLQAPVVEKVITTKRITDWTTSTLLDACERWICRQLTDAQLGDQLQKISFDPAKEKITAIVERIEAIAKRAKPEVPGHLVERYKYDTFMRCVHPVLPMYNFVMKNDKDKNDIRTAMELALQYEEEDGGNYQWYMAQNHNKSVHAPQVPQLPPTAPIAPKDLQECNYAWLNPRKPPPNPWEAIANALNEIAREKRNAVINDRAKSGQQFQTNGYRGRDRSTDRSNDKKPWTSRSQTKTYQRPQGRTPTRGNDDKNFWIKGKRYRQANTTDLVTDDEWSDHDELNNDSSCEQVSTLAAANEAMAKSE